MQRHELSSGLLPYLGSYPRSLLACAHQGMELLEKSQSNRYLRCLEDNIWLNGLQKPDRSPTTYNPNPGRRPIRIWTPVSLFAYTPSENTPVLLKHWQRCLGHAAAESKSNSTRLFRNSKHSNSPLAIEKASQVGEDKRVHCQGLLSCEQRLLIRHEAALLRFPFPCFNQCAGRPTWLPRLLCANSITITPLRVMISYMHHYLVYDSYGSIFHI